MNNNKNKALNSISKRTGVKAKLGKSGKPSFNRNHQTIKKQNTIGNRRKSRQIKANNNNNKVNGNSKGNKINGRGTNKVNTNKVKGNAKGLKTNSKEDKTTNKGKHTMNKNKVKGNGKGKGLGRKQTGMKKILKKNVSTAGKVNKLRLKITADIEYFKQSDAQKAIDEYDSNLITINSIIIINYYLILIMTFNNLNRS